jgi:hypothetical protein
VLLSIVGVDRLEGNAHYAGKLMQEALLSSGPVPFTIQRATQFHEFAAQVVGWTRVGQVAIVPPLLVQPVAAADVGDVLAEIAAGVPRGRATDLAGPEPQDLVDMARRTLSAWGESIRLIPSWRNGVFGVEAAGEALLAGPEAWLAPTTFDTWLTRQSAMAPPSSPSWSVSGVVRVHIISSFSVTERSKEAKRSRHGQKCLHRISRAYYNALVRGNRTDTGTSLAPWPAPKLQAARIMLFPGQHTSGLT